MSRGLHMLGASGDALRGHAIVARVESVDATKLKSAIGRYGGAIDLAIDFASWQPKAAIDAAIPFIRKQLADVGINATVTAGTVATRGPSEFWGGLVVGGALGGGALAIWKLVGRLIRGRV